MKNLNLDAFKGPLKAVAKDFIKTAKLTTQQEVDEFADILRRGKNLIGQGGKMRNLIIKETLQTFRYELDPYSTNFSKNNTAANVLVKYLD
jgi:hypothetical protein